MGWGLPAAVGAFYAKNNMKKSRVICLTGDGGFQLNIQELDSPICNIVYHNSLHEFEDNLNLVTLIILK